MFRSALTCVLSDLITSRKLIVLEFTPPAFPVAHFPALYANTHKYCMKTHFVIVGISVAWYPALSAPQAILREWRVVDWDWDILYPFLLPCYWVDSVLDSKRLPVDSRELFLLEGLEVVLRKTSVDALLKFQGIPDFGGVFMKRHNWQSLKVKSGRKIKDKFRKKHWYLLVFSNQWRN